MIDEDAFGVLFSYYEVEDDEYGLEERADFVQRFVSFEQLVLELLRGMALPSDHHIVSFGHAVYAEFRDLGESPELFLRLRKANSQLTGGGFVNVTVLSHGSRWVVPEQEPELSLSELSPRIARVSRPSEPLRRALGAETLARRDEHLEGWGPGVYVDTEALESLGRTPKNAPTALLAPGAQFFRIPALPVEAK